MKTFNLVPLLLLGLSAAKATAQVGATQSGAPPVEAAAEGKKSSEAPVAVPGEPEASDIAADGATNNSSGRFVQLARLPEAELLVDVTLVGNDPLARYQIKSDKTGALLLHCDADCRFRTWPGRYHLITKASAGFVGGSNVFVVERDSMVRVVEPSVARPVLGVILGSIGMASAVVGAVLLSANGCGSECSSDTANRSKVGLAAIGAGAVIAPIGWILFAQNWTPELSVNPRTSGNVE